MILCGQMRGLAALRPGGGPPPPTLGGLVDAYFARLPARSLSRAAFDAFAGGNRTSRACAVVQVLRGTAYVPDGVAFPHFHEYRLARLVDVAVLLQLAAGAGGGPAVPDVDLLVCPSDHGNLDADARDPSWSRVPAVGPHTQAGNPSAIPFPMLSRSTRSYWIDSHADAHLFAPHYPDVVRRLHSDRRHLRWGNKTARAVFRGDLKSRECRRGDRRFCFRNEVIRRLRGRAGFDVVPASEADSFMPWRSFDSFRIIMVVGYTNSSCSDRLMEALSMNSVLLWVDGGSIDWYWPLLSERVHYLRAEESIESIEEQVRWGLARDPEMQEIAARMHEKAVEILRLDHILTYAALVARAAARTLNYTPVLRRGMVPLRLGDLGDPVVAAFRLEEFTRNRLRASAARRGMLLKDFFWGTIFRPLFPRTKAEFERVMNSMDAPDLRFGSVFDNWEYYTG